MVTDFPRRTALKDDRRKWDCGEWGWGEGGHKAQVPEISVRWGGSPEKMKKSRVEAAARANERKVEGRLAMKGAMCDEGRKAKLRVKIRNCRLSRSQNSHRLLERLGSS